MKVLRGRSDLILKDLLEADSGSEEESMKARI